MQPIQNVRIFGLVDCIEIPSLLIIFKHNTEIVLRRKAVQESILTNFVLVLDV